MLGTATGVIPTSRGRRRRAGTFRRGWWGRWSVAILALVVVAGAAARTCCAQPLQPASANPDDPGAAERIELWVRQLDDDRFVVRTRATDQLILAGVLAIQPVAQAVEAGNLEVATRGILILRELALSSDVAAQEQGLSALQKLARSQTRSAARLAQAAVDALADVRQQRTIEQLQQLGAKIEMTDQPIGFELVRYMAVEIGDQWVGSVEDLQRLRWLQDVRDVTFIGRRVTDAWLDALRDMEQLDRVAIKSAQVTDEAVRTISRLKSVTKVDLMYTPVTDAGLQHLREMKGLLLVRCFGTEITREAAERFQADMVQVTMQHKLGAFLGVSCQRSPWPCEVLQVTQQSAALKAGVQVRDIIISYDHQDVATFDDLEKLIARNKVGDTVEIEVARGGEAVILAMSRRPLQNLGLAGDPTAIGVKITQVEPKQGAANAGLRVGDIVASVDDQRIATLQELTKRYRDDAESAVARFQLLRDVEILTMKVTFGEWDQ